MNATPQSSKTPPKRSWRFRLLWGFPFVILVALWFSSGWRDDFLSLNAEGTNYTIGLQRGNIVVGYSITHSPEWRWNWHGLQHAFEFWWKPQVLETHQGMVTLIPFWIPLSLYLGVAMVLVVQRQAKGLAARRPYRIPVGEPAVIPSPQPTSKGLDLP